MSAGWTTLANLPPGALFETADGTRAVKSRHVLTWASDQPECVEVGTGRVLVCPRKGRTRVRRLDVGLLAVPP